LLPLYEEGSKKDLSPRENQVDILEKKNA